VKSTAFQSITTDPVNGAPTPEALATGHITAVEHFFVRNHAAPPALAPAGVVRVGGLVLRTGSISLTGLPRTRVEASLQCAGNRRCGLAAHREIPDELPWTNEAIGNAIWEGVSLAAVLESAGITERDTGGLHVWFTGADVVSGKGKPEAFGASIPFAKAMRPEVIVADTMNGAPLDAHHGAPLRVIVPGYIGARSVKWLTDIRVERVMSTSRFQSAYSIVSASGPQVLGALPVNSALALPDSCTLPSGAQTVRGWAIGSDDAVIERVEVSADGGATWANARLTSPERRFVWRLWEARVTLTRGACELVCRAFDSSGAAQPARAADVWNARGYLNNSWHRVAVYSP
jgi:sulfite oxidase